MSLRAAVTFPGTPQLSRPPTSGGVTWWGDVPGPLGLALRGQDTLKWIQDLL